MKVKIFFIGIVAMALLRSNFNNQEKIVKVLSAEKICDTASKHFGKYAENCKKWNLTKTDIAKIILSSDKISTHEAHYFYEILPCSYIGELVIKGKKARYTVNAGALSEIKYSDTTFFHGYKKSNYKKYFIIGPGID